MTELEYLKAIYEILYCSFAIWLCFIIYFIVKKLVSFLQIFFGK